MRDSLGLLTAIVFLASFAGVPVFLQAIFLDRYFGAFKVEVIRHILYAGISLALCVGSVAVAVSMDLW